MSNSLPHVEGVSHRFIKVNGVQLHLAEAGSGPPLLMLHGWPQHWYMWRYQIPHLAQKYRLICPDLRGFGWSEAPPTGYKKEELVDDIISLLDALKIDQIKLIGHDWGGWVGFLLCLRQPERIQKYIALNIPHPFQKIDSRILTLGKFWYQLVLSLPFLGKWIVQDKINFVRRGLQKAMVLKKWTEEELSIYTTRFNEPARARATVLLYRTHLLHEFMPVITGRYSSCRLKAPTLLLFGKKDTAISPKLLKGYEPYADNFKVELISDCGHFIAEENPDLVTTRAIDFFGNGQ